MEFLDLSTKEIEQNLCNLGQVVFEVTSACNLRCYYCAYGELYQKIEGEAYSKQGLSFQKGKTLLDFLINLWQKKGILSSPKELLISFYGGEPLLNMSFIKRIVTYVNELHLTNLKVRYSLTTNGTLLDKHAEYLRSIKATILISLDGDQIGDSYRVDRNGRPSFNQVFKNIQFVQQEYPEYFEKFISFNSVLHNKNSFINTYNFILNNFNKETMVSSLSLSNVSPEKKEDFTQIYKSVDSQFQDYLKLGLDYDSDVMFNFPIIFDLLVEIFNNSGNVYRNYNELLLNVDKTRKHPTGTCTPFSKKLFMSVDGFLYPCERVAQKFKLGKVGETVFIDLEHIANLYNSMFHKISRQCNSCNNNTTCLECMFQCDGILGETLCRGYIDRKQYENKMRVLNALLIKYPKLYKVIMSKTIFS